VEDGNEIPRGLPAAAGSLHDHVLSFQQGDDELFLEGSQGLIAGFGDPLEEVVVEEELLEFRFLGADGFAAAK
jgi:hypothetical protein